MEFGDGEPKEKDIVWVKMKGYLWYPGIIMIMLINIMKVIPFITNKIFFNNS